MDWFIKFAPLIGMVVEFVVAMIILIWRFKKSNNHDEKLKLTQAVLSTISSFCIEAENMFGATNGIYKKQWAMQQAKLKCVELGVTIPDEVLSTAIEDTITATNSINTNKGA